MSVAAGSGRRRLADLAGSTPPRWLEAGVLCALAVFSAIPLAALIRHAALHDLAFAGADSPFPADQFQYEAWIQQFSSGLLAANTLDTAPSDRVFLHPMFLLSGLASRAGVSVDAAYLLWKPVAVLVVFVCFRAYVARFLEDQWPRLAALAIALFFASPAPVIISGAASMAGPGVLSWGYLPAVLSVGLMPLFLVGLERVVRTAPEGALAKRPLDLVAVCACGLAIAWIHPWQGEVLLVIVAAAAVLDRDRRRKATLMLVPTVALLAPLFYYFLLTRFDASWSFAQQENAGGGRLETWAIVVGLLPIVLPALAGVRRRWDDIGERMLELWPLAVIVVYVASPQFPQHAFEGLSLPLAVLAVRGLSRVRRRLAWGAALVALLVVPGSVHALRLMRNTVHAGTQPFYLDRGDERALEHLSNLQEPGAVLSTPYLGSLVPARTGRQTWVAHPTWTRDFPARAFATDALFAGRLSPVRARAVVRDSRAVFVLDGCGNRGRALPALRPIVTSVRRFRCARVYRVSGNVAPGS